MKLEKAVIETGKPKQAIEVLFNPNEFTLRRSNQLGQIGGTRRKEPCLQYTSGNSSTLAMSLFIDTYEDRTDARDHTDKIYALLDPAEPDKAPPICTFRWGGFAFRGVLESVDGRFTLFLPNGTPARATLSISFKGTPDKRTPGTASAGSAALQKSRVLREGDTLNILAAALYGDPGLWRPIARANGIHDPLALRAGAQLTLPGRT